MSFWKSLPGALVILAVFAGGAGLSMGAFQVHRVTHPMREAAAGNLGAELAKVEEVSFRSADGVDLKGWMLNGPAGRPPIVVCHDLGEDKNALINLAIALNKAGFTVLTFDFRAHGASGGSCSTLGVEESRDVLGAVDFLGTLEPGRVSTQSIGIFGAGMGAHAAVLAAADRPSLQVLVLDGLWPDARWTLVQRSMPDWPWGQKHLGSVPAMLFPLIAGTKVSERRAADVLPALAGRDLLLVAPAGDARLDDEMKAMYAMLPEQRDSERNLITLPGTRASGLNSGELTRYHARVVDFFASRLARP